MYIQGGIVRLVYMIRAGMSNNGCMHAGETWNPEAARSIKLSGLALPAWCWRSRELLRSHWSLFHVGRLNKQGRMSGEDGASNNIKALTGKKRKQEGKSAHLFPGSSLFLGHLQEGAACSEDRPLNSVTPSWRSCHRPTQRHISHWIVHPVKLTTNISHSKPVSVSYALCCTIIPRIQNVSPAPLLKAVCLLLFCASMV